MRKSRKQRGRTVIVEHDNVDKAIKKLRRLVTDNNIMKQYYQHCYYTKKSAKRRRKQSLKKFKAKIWQEKQDQKLKSRTI